MHYTEDGQSYVSTPLSLAAALFPSEPDRKERIAQEQPYNYAYGLGSWMTPMYCYDLYRQHSDETFLRQIGTTASLQQRYE